MAIRTFDIDQNEIYTIQGSEQVLTRNNFEKIQALMNDVSWLVFHVVQPWEYPIWHPGFQKKTLNNK